MAVSGFKGISRIDQPHKHNHGWYVRVAFQKKVYSKFFSDLSNDGRDKALRKAVRYRNALEVQFGKPRTDRLVVASPPCKRRGVVGVVRTLKPTRTRTGKLTKSPVYEVTWSPEPNKVKRTSFSILKHGEKGAFLKAYKLRKKVERQIYGREIPSRPIVPSRNHR
jgi:hypothetical protein